MVKTMKRGLSLMFVLSLLVSMLAIPAKATNGSKSVTLKSNGKDTEYVTITTDKSFLGWKNTTITIRNTSNRPIQVYRGEYWDQGSLNPGGKMTFTFKANGQSYGFKLQRGWWGSGDAVAKFTVNNGHF